MKSLIIIFALFSHFCIAQSNRINECGLETNPRLNKCEIEYFNATLKKKRHDFDFEGKKVAFAWNNYGNDIITKKDYFDRWGKEYFSKGQNVVNQLLILTKEEKEESGGFDAIIVSWSKISLTRTHRAKLIKKLKKDNSV